MIKINFRELIKWFVKSIVGPFFKFIKQDNTIIIQTYSHQIYCDNSRYLYEYLSKNTEYKIYWVTNNPKIKSYLKNRNFLYISTSNYLKLLYISAKAKIVIDSGTDFFNPMGLLGKRVTSISTLHGSHPKAMPPKCDELQDIRNPKKIYHCFDYINNP